MRSCQLCAQCGHQLLAGCATATLQLWNTARQSQQCEAGEMLFRQSEAGAGLYCLESGLVKLYRSNSQGETQTSRLVAGRSVLGHCSWLTCTKLPWSARALRPTHYCYIPRSVVDRCLDLDPRLGRNLATLLARSLLQTEHRLFAQSKLPLKVRLAELMLDMAEAEGQLLSLSRSELADWEGVSPESISRSLKSLKDDGCIAIRGHKIEVTDAQALRELVEAF